MFRVEVKVKRLVGPAKLPRKATEGSACYDVYANGPHTLRSGFVSAVSTGLAFEVPASYFLDIRPRSGLSLHKILLANAPGTLDSDYRGELKILLYNLGNKDYLIRDGDRIAQISIRVIPEVVFIETERLSKTNRGEKGFGSTGR